MGITGIKPNPGVKIGCRFCVSARVRQIYGLRVDPKEVGVLLDYLLKPALHHPRDLHLENLRDPLTQKFLFFCTIAKTRFFRDMYLMGMTEKILKDILDRKLAAQTGRPRIKIWSMGCSQGQEPYSVAMLIRRREWHEKADFEILGTDIVVRHLVFAQKGKNYIVDDWEGPLNYYPGAPEIPQEYEPFVQYHGNMIDLRPEVRSMVNFRLANVLDARDYEGRDNMDLILVNNVFCYFDKESIKRALGLLVPSLSSGGVVISKDLSDELIAEIGTPLQRLKFEELFQLVVNGRLLDFKNRLGYRAYQKF